MRRHAPRLAAALLLTLGAGRPATVLSAEAIARHAPPPPATAPSPPTPAQLEAAHAKPPLPRPARASAPATAAPANPALTSGLPDLVPAMVGFAQIVMPFDANDHPAGIWPPYVEPNYLLGDSPTTRTAYAIKDDAYEPVTPFYAARMLDGAVMAIDPLPSLDGLASWEMEDFTGRSIPGGRHTLGIVADPDNAIPEYSETNNAWANQWVWQPTQLSTGGSVTRTGVPEPSGGQSDIPGGPSFFANCDGLRTPDFVGDPIGFGGYWNAVAVCAVNANDDVDLSLFPPTTGPANGFEYALRFSNKGTGLTDLVLVDADDAGGGGGSPGPRDIGTTLYTGSTSLSYAVSTIPSAWLGVVQGVVINRTIGAGRLLALWEVPLPAGDHTIQLDNLSGGANLDMAVVPRNPGSGGYYNIGDMGWYGATSALGSSGMSEAISLVGQPAGYYALIVWKHGSNDLPKAANFQIRIADATNGVDAAAPAVASRFEDASPNPVRESAALSFSLARDAHVELAIHDLAGRRVATVANGAYAAGAHTLTWNGRGDDGRRLPGGLYFARFDGDGLRQTRKLTVVR